MEENYYFIGEWQKNNILLRKEKNYYSIQNCEKKSHSGNSNPPIK